ncbi:hypothetical protein AM493_09145 [Flavobacterium akiainvivens]|uniref:Uncharacterized protein n=1 Tax=Flavobacterium akiainvivens TaxID=1202724 RepID=A0A0M8MID6_9FLAO|nr:hypothetical protein [Flavobacterium akiainvivens]KOS06178.1 hypothetical protein AM493_09145 [Flavobacterium akiainvivens]SFQ68294.1 hypothetical protein SAMN05444144_11463 [Flavobacterium akiainvivens]
MKRFLTIAAIVLIPFAGIYLYGAMPGNIFTETALKNYEREAVSNKSFIIFTPNTKDYAGQCAEEDKRGIRYPGKAAYALLHSQNYFSPGKRLAATQMEELLTLLNDSASYDWGELGTPEVHYYFTFHDNADKCIGVTTIDLLGQTYSYPPTAHMKWGLLNKMDRVKQIIDQK